MIGDGFDDLWWYKVKHSKANRKNYFFPNRRYILHSQFTTCNYFPLLCRLCRAIIFCDISRFGVDAAHGRFSFLVNFKNARLRALRSPMQRFWVRWVHWSMVGGWPWIFYKTWDESLLLWRPAKRDGSAEGFVWWKSSELNQWVVRGSW